MLREVRILVPDKLYNLLEKIEKEHGIRKEDLILRVLIRTVESYLGEKVYAS